MTKKKLSKKSKSFIGEVSDLTKRLSADKAEVDHEFATGNEKALNLMALQEN